MIGDIEAALIRLISGCLGDEVDVATGPGDWDPAYVRSLLTTLPAVRVVFDGGEQETQETFVTLQSAWAVFVVVGWKGQPEATRRQGADGAYVFLDVLIPALHAARLTDSRGKTMTVVGVESVANLWTSALSASNMAVYAIGLSCDMPFDSDPATAKGRLDDFLEAGVELELPDDPTADLPAGDFPVPQ